MPRLEKIEQERNQKMEFAKRLTIREGFRGETMWKVIAYNF
jgi:hypothetical protein